ncbi:hypothetical protein SGFS_002170 [Streptomyces graminofaciens]|uniref:Uncharacterized protein n=1 Tax=Streptomyces graminofaciens TaxID=68212 RepID=A0ABN5V7G8_9ACTN|nr:hypothetical protein [Streptomyces graminofaciens]BBC28926.1 hypothetical protein SGFS_002170 [Streptomyces graminofaciens]
MFTDWLAALGIPVLVIRGFSSQSYVDIVRARTAHRPRSAPRSPAHARERVRRATATINHKVPQL